ncbi:TonB-dependent receptor [Sulfidibacter corallicola]|uniref:TonB-dependent receptor n=1 Tax=Sulfidibacter corallicola TaxID=2818388 RepID=A0A8A4TMI1_SULCO|nr:TonB-dependent receptor [Sulfidibacter corallicola]QTD50760.1 TonB-dependent receptor [Sulfidibacter corallicola]
MTLQSKIFSALFILFLAGGMGLAQDTGTVNGTVYNKDDGSTLPTASVRIVGSDKVVFTDVNGFYNLRGVPAGTYEMIAEFAGFSDMTIEGVEVKAGQITTVNFELGGESLQETIKVVYEVAENNELGIINKRKKSPNVTDGISAEEISRAGGGNAAEAVKKIPGASVVGGKHVYIRGLGDRYTSTHLNGIEMPTPDPDVKSFQADLLPANILDNVVTLKTFTPNKPGNFSGGIIDVGTKAYPPGRTLKINYGTNYIEGSTFNDDYLNYGTSGTDWIGSDNGLRELPSIVNNGDIEIPTLIEARRDEEKAQLLDEISKAFEPVMSPGTSKAPINQSFGVSMGDQIELSGINRLGYMASLSYNRKRTYYDDWERARWKLTEAAASANTLNNQSTFDSEQGKDKVNWGGLVTLNYLAGTNHELGATFVYTQGGESTSEYYVGQWPEQFSTDNAFLESRFLKYSERNLTSSQLRGEHYFPNFLDAKVKWTGAVSTTDLDEPDTRIFTSNFSRRTLNGEEVLIYSITRSIYNNPARYWRELQEDGSNFNLDVDIPLNLWNGQRGTFSFGYAYDKKDRDFTELRFEYQSDANVRYQGDPETFFSPDNVGVIGFDADRGRYTFGNVIQLAPDSRGGNYSGDQEVTAAYVMAQVPINDNLRVITGARLEQTDMFVTNEAEDGQLDEDDVLPSLHFIYKLSDDQNLRISYGRTLARPTFREKAPYSSFDFLADGIFAGNPDLKRTLIDNFDMRWEYFLNSGQLYAISGFYKEFQDPIEKAYNVAFSSEFGEKTFINVEEATVYGVELEARKVVTPLSATNRVSVGGNVSLIKSIVDIPADELALLRNFDPDADDTRELQGQSPYLVNLSVNYDNLNTNTSASIYYNVFGERLDQVGVGAAPDAKEQPRSLVDLIFSQDLGRGLQLKFSAKNLMDDPIEIVQEFKGQDFIQSRYKVGRSYSLSLSFKPF